MTPKQKAQQWIDDNCLILDTETTGLGDDAEIVEITVIDTAGKPLLNTLVKPKSVIPVSAIAIHGITNEMVNDAPSWPEVCSELYPMISGRKVVIYNSGYDTRVIDQTNEDWGITEHLNIEWPTFECAMLAYAEFYGQKSDRGGYKWQKLTAAAEQQGVVIEGTPHRALSDCLTTLGIIKAMAAEEFPHHIRSVLNELKYASEAAAWEPRVYEAIFEAVVTIECQDEVIEQLKAGRNRFGEYSNELKDRYHCLEQYSNANFLSKKTAELQRDALLMAIGGTEDGRIIDITKPEEATEQAVIIIRQSFRDLKQYRDLEEIPFGAVEQDHEVAQLQRQIDEKDLLLQQAKENERRAMDCFARAVAFAKGAEGDPCYITELAKEVADLADEVRKK
ncbi:3'-5' exonuclease [Serratia marcescens]|uniref:3'-5' exonuclease n=1 Tax=Serratia marcescens TaxID=615 RepID=UPI002FC554F6|nr:3'-5' exonuclease [Serratia marcescens]